MKQKNAKRKSDMTLEEMYNSQYDFGDDEDDDSDWEPSALPDHNVVEIPKWFCLNCTVVNIGADFHCDVGISLLVNSFFYFMSFFFGDFLLTYKQMYFLQFFYSKGMW